MKIILYAPSIHSGGGTERVLVNLANELEIRNFQVEIFVQTIGNNYFYELSKTIKVNQIWHDKIAKVFNRYILLKIIKKIFGSFILQCELYKKIATSDFIIIAFSNSIVISCFSTSLRTRLVAFEHWPYWITKNNKKLNIKINAIYPRLKKVIVLTDFEKNEYEKFGCRVIKIPNAYVCLPDQKSILESKIVLSVGHFNSQKRRDLLIEAWRYVSLSHPDWRLIIVGDGHLYHEALEQIKKYKLEEIVHIASPQHNISKFYLNASIFVLSSEYEALPMVLIEAKSYGLPCVSFNIQSGPNEIIRDNIDGYLVDFEDCHMMAKKISILISNSEMRNNFGLEARSDCQIRFSPIEIYQEWEKFLNEMI